MSYFRNNSFWKTLGLIGPVFFFSACVSRSPLMEFGVQEKYTAINLSRILAIPVMVLPDPYAKSTVEMATLQTDGVAASLESQVLASFSGHPAVKGVPFKTVKGRLGNPTKTFSDLEAELTRAAKVSRGPLTLETVDGPKQCTKCKNLAEFYQYSLLPSRQWKEALNSISAQVDNADAAMFVILTNLQKKQVEKNVVHEAGVLVLLADTNTGQLIWSRLGNDTLEGNATQSSTTLWGALFQKILSEEFWKDYPGRRSTALPQEEK